MASDDDDFDWAAAVEEIDRACSRPVASGEGVWGEPSSSQSRAFHQKTLDCFVRGPPKHGSSANVPESRFRERTLDPFLGHQRFAATASRARNNYNDRDPGEGECHLPLDREAARIWIYPANVPHRTYQFNIAKSALFCNTLVCLPTGLGKTLIAAVVMYNYFRWFPTGKIVFAAPSRPLVVQQIEACHMVTGIPQSMTIDMTGQMNPQIRGEHWQSKRVFFVTPQVLEKDMKSGRSASKQIVCLVLDEAHRATGNYAYCVVVRELLAANVEPRILALTATPGSQQATIQAVVDNLRISCLEYRDENDSDVRQYTHNRKIELIEVALNADCARVKDVFIEVVQPIVQRLCYLGVFYNRDISKLTPFEFLSARDKFRQAPPPALQQSRYPEVENYFGLAITLFHVFKLLITHGMRAAYEMLRQKVEQGVLKKLAKNEKLCQVQDLMKQSIGHGAPNPKLEKVAEIVNHHFSLRGVSDTRVIIFTNFRESVKDIIEKLGASCSCVKAMEFIGQSSGKFSKGQTQKTQQAVLQRFRGGCYNTIVATSIAEEGLDIMEVDLVICFDANISPLRMIQRMGRTGRKRDGRVVVLASGGPEIQGYLRKQAKSKVLSKHMVNGGLQSFNFHPSHHMIPHSLQTTVQYMELSIEAFIPRGRKSKDKHAKEGNGSRRTLSESELEVLKLIKELPGVEPKVPSRAADSEHPAFAGPVGFIKHSKRSCLLMDVLQTLRVGYHQDREEQVSREKASSPATGESGIPTRCSSPTPPSLTNSAPNEEVPDESLLGHSHIEGEGRDVDPSEGPQAVPGSQKEPRASQKLLDDRTKTATDGEVLQTPRTPQTPQTSQTLPYLLSDRPDLTYFEILKEQQAKGYHSCSFSNGVVSVSESGVIRICSPPVLNFSRRDEVDVLNSTHQHENLRVGVTASGQTPGSLNATKEDHDFAVVCKSPNLSKSSGRVVNSLRHSVAGTKSTAYGALETMEFRSMEKSMDQDRNRQQPLSGFERPKPAGGERDRSNLVPLEQLPAYSLDTEGSRMLPTIQPKTATGASRDDISCQGRTGGSPQSPEKISPDSSLRITAAVVIPAARVPDLSRNLEARRSGIASESGERVLHRTSPVGAVVDGHDNGKSLTDDEIFQQDKASASFKNKSPLQILNSAGGKEDWQCQDPGSIPRRRKFKRLLRVCEKRPVFDSRGDGKRGEPPSAQGAVASKVHRSMSHKEKRGRKFAARIFIDEEAGVSSDETNGDSSENDDGDEENGDSLDSFIDSTATQHLNGSVEMVAIYRRSLLTPSPSDSLAATRMGLQHLCTTPEITPSSRGSPPASTSLTASLENIRSRSSSHSNPPSEDAPHTQPAATPTGNFVVPMTPNGTSQSMIAANRPSDNINEESEDQKKPELLSLKRKLQFESISAFDDDLFRDVDLDALEAEATAISRSRFGGQQDIQKQICPTGEKSDEMKSSTPTCGPSSATEKANEFQFFPSFDLGLDL